MTASYIQDQNDRLPYLVSKISC